MMTTRSPLETLALWLAHLVVRVVPRGPLRARYSHELAAELASLPPGRQVVVASSLLVRAWALRRAVLTMTTGTTSRVPVLCTLNAVHDWHLEHTDDGGLYWRCRRCGKDDDGLWRRSFGIDVYRGEGRGSVV